MLYKVLAVAALLGTSNAGGGGANSVDPRMMWFRWAIPRGGGYDSANDEQDHVTYGNADGQNIRTCGVDVAPNSIRKCYFTDCFENLHKFPSSRRRMGGNVEHYNLAYGPNGGLPGCGKQDGPTSRRRMANAPHLAIQCKSNTCSATTDTRQFRYWKKGAAAFAGLDPTTAKPNGPCPGGNDAKPEESWQWYGSAQKAGENCIYAAPPATCHCKTVVCRVSTDAGKHLDSAKWDNSGTAADLQDGDECNFMVRIEDVWPSPGVSKKMMWWIFAISAFISLAITAYYYVTFGDELVKEGEGSEGSGGN